jgi:hypothetical protein
MAHRKFYFTSQCVFDTHRCAFLWHFDLYQCCEMRMLSHMCGTYMYLWTLCVCVERVCKCATYL